MTGIRYRTADGTESELRADLVVATDGRHSTLRRAAGLAPKEFRVPFDTWWFRLPRYASEQGAVAGIIPAFGRGEALLALNRTDYYQMGYLAPKGTDARIRAEGLERFRQRIAALRPDLADRVDAISSLADLHWLDVRLDRLRDWHINGLLCIGDAAHAMSPAGGVGINLAIQDAVAAADCLAPALLRGRVSRADLARVERRRRMPTVVVQTVQRVMHRTLFGPIMTGQRAGAPAVLLCSWPGTSRPPGRSCRGLLPSDRGPNTRPPSPGAPRNVPSRSKEEEGPIMGQLVVQEFVTADGFAANTNNEFNAYEMLEGGTAEFDRSQLAWLDTVEAMVLGASTYRMFAEFWPTPASDGEVIAAGAERSPPFRVFPHPQERTVGRPARGNH